MVRRSFRKLKVLVLDLVALWACPGLPQVALIPIRTTPMTGIVKRAGSWGPPGYSDRPGES
jgi:hypothetical protein